MTPEHVFPGFWALLVGELARLAIAMMTVAEVDLLILDEPTNNLDSETVVHNSFRLVNQTFMRSY